VDDFKLLADLHKPGKRQGPGGDRETRQAIELAMLDEDTPLKIADIGCGTGASALQLARSLNAEITAVDFLPEFVEELDRRAAGERMGGKIDPVVGSMENLEFEQEAFDVIWSEGAIYNMGFQRGVSDWMRFLRPGGVLAVSEITWLSNDRPPEIQRYWQGQYPEIASASSKMGILENTGYSPIGYFALPKCCWTDNYYRPLQRGFGPFLARHNDSEQARAIVSAEEQEIALYEKYGEHYSYGFYIARKPGGRRCPFK
jgi:SAM-dependent methyltransferase